MSKKSLWHKSRSLPSSELNEVYKQLLDRLGHQRWWPGDTPFEIMVGAILTQNTAWINVEKAIQNLKNKNVLAPHALKKMSHEELALLLKPAGYFNIKAKRLKNLIDFLHREYDGDLNRMKRESGETLRHKLLSVNGIGPETADSILLYALDKPFFVIDAYTKRIFSRHKLSIHQKKLRRLKSDDPYVVWQAVFEAALPQKANLFNDFHAQIVAIGKGYCKNQNPRCESCPLQKYL